MLMCEDCRREQKVNNTGQFTMTARCYLCKEICLCKEVL